MTCPNCTAHIPDESAFCNKCGFRLAPEQIAALADRIAALEQKLEQRIGQQHCLEVETAERVMTRVKTWTTLILYFAGIPATIALLALAIVFGKGAFDLHTIAKNAQSNVGAILEQSRNAATETKRTADEALLKTKQVDSDIRQTRESVSRLKEQVDGRIAEVRSLGERINVFQERVTSLKSAMDSQSQQLHTLSDEVKGAKTNRNLQEVITTYPVLGEHHVSSRNGWIDPKQKEPGLTYLTLTFSFTKDSGPRGSEVSAKMANLMGRLDESKYKVFLDFVGLYAGGPTGSQGIGVPLNSDSCRRWPNPSLAAPCILYFREDLRDSAMRVRELLKPIQTLTDTSVVYVNPEGLEADKQELLKLSHMDIVAVLNPAL